MTPSLAAAIVAGTFVSEDLTSVAVGVMIRSGRVEALPGLAACLTGIYLGDLGLWGAGRLMRSRTAAARTGRVASWLDGNLAMAVIASRFLPGTRLPLYLAAGALGRRTGPFFIWSFVAALLWTPVIVLASARVGPALVALLLLFHLARLASTETGRAWLAAAAGRIRRWEFWPAWAVYAPVTAWIGWLSLRHGGFTTITAANPGIPDGGFVGESKHEILSKLPARWIVPSLLLPAGEGAPRASLLAGMMASHGWSFPVVLKPDAGQRGTGVVLARDAAAAADYLETHRGPVLAQLYHPGPFEAGIFYYRIPGEPRGRIFSITDKVFPAVTGDGRSTLERLVWSHPRYRMQARALLAGLGSDAAQVPAPGERVVITMAGNHARGTMFLDGARLYAPDLETRIDGIARAFPGFHFGRFDVRYTDVEAFRRGEDLAIVELNGVTSESTDIYDPRRSIVSAWRTLCRQWSLLFRIGEENRRRGAAATRAPRLLGNILSYYLPGMRLAWSPWPARKAAEPSRPM